MLHARHALSGSVLLGALFAMNACGGGDQFTGGGDGTGGASTGGASSQGGSGTGASGGSSAGGKSGSGGTHAGHGGTKGGAAGTTSQGGSGGTTSHGGSATAGTSSQGGSAAGGSSQAGSGTAGTTAQGGTGTAGTTAQGGTGTAGTTAQGGTGTAGDSSQGGSGTAGTTSQGGVAGNGGVAGDGGPTQMGIGGTGTAGGSNAMAGPGGSDQGQGGSVQPAGAGGSLTQGQGGSVQPAGAGGSIAMGGISAQGGSVSMAGTTSQGVGGTATAGAPGCGTFTECEAGSAIPPSAACDKCVGAVCEQIPACCEDGWDSQCAVLAHTLSVCSCSPFQCGATAAGQDQACTTQFTCNAITGTGCGTLQCELHIADGGQELAQCLLPGTVAGCGACSENDVTSSCSPGFSCVQGFCLRTCCDAADCTDGGFCDTAVLGSGAPIGVCAHN